MTLYRYISHVFHIICLSLACSAGVVAQTGSQTEFDQWLDALKQEALAEGIRQETIDVALAQVQFIERVIESDRKQAEFTESYAEYLKKRVSPWRIEKGREYIRAHESDLSRVSQKYRVPGRFVASILGVETNYGTFKLSHSLFDVLVTLAYDPRRGERFRKEVFAALTIVDKGYAELGQLKSSWAGALGMPQFMPSTYLQFAVDDDGDGKKDIWNHGPDLYASVANYLSHYGWQDDQAWARKVLLPNKKHDSLLVSDSRTSDAPKACQRYLKHLEVWRGLDDWDYHGVRRMNTAHLPNVNIAASLIVTNENANHGYLVYGNFCALMRYNPSFKYALTVGVLSDNLKYTN